jgi:hypothetical protein
MCAGLDVSPGLNFAKENQRKYGQQNKTCSKLSAVVAIANFRKKKKFVDF